MKKDKLLFAMLFIALLVIFSCSEDSTSSDNEPPTVVITYPANNSEFAQGSVITIIANATDNKGIKEVRFYIDEDFVSLDETEPYQYEWDTGNSRDTNHTIYAKAYDISDNSATSEVLTVTLTEPVGSPPNPPSNPNPADNATSVSTNANLSWTCSDPDGDPLTYDVYFGTFSNPPLENSGQSGTTYDLGTLNEETTYYWKIVAHDDNSNSTIGDIWVFTTTIGGVTGTVTDIDGNVYQTLVIGDQEWMVENLKVTHYRNGDLIPNVTDNSTWASLSTGAYCYYENDPANADTYGALYNWYAVDDSRNIAPEGWHVPSDEEIKELEMYLGMSEGEANDTGWRGTNEGSKLAGGYDLWYSGSLRNDPEFDSSGFSFLPGGYRYDNDGTFANLGHGGYWWSSADYSSTDAWRRHLRYNYAQVYRSSRDKRGGFSVRCVRD